MEKKLLLAVVISALILVVYYLTLDVPPKVQPPLREELEKFGARKVVAQEPPAREISPPLPRQGVVQEGRDVIVETQRYRLVLTTHGARIKSIRLKEYPEIWKDNKELEKEIELISRKLNSNRGKIDQIEMKLKNERDELQLNGLRNTETSLKEEGQLLKSTRDALVFVGEKTVERQRRIAELEKELEEANSRDERQRAGLLENELRGERGAELVSPAALSHGDYPLTLSFPEFKVDLNDVVYGCDVQKVDLTGDRKKATVEFVTEVREGVNLKKVFTVSAEEYVIGLDVVVENNSPGTVGDERAMLTYGPGVGFIEKAQVRGATRKVVSYTYDIGGRAKVRFESVEGRRASIAPGKKSELRMGDWVGLRSKYFAAVLIPRGGRREMQAENLGSAGQKVGVRLSSFSIGNGETFSADFKIYLGPQKIEELKKVGHSLEEIIDYGFWEPIAKVIQFMLGTFFRAVGNYGWSIVLLSLFIKIVFYPLTHRSFEGMRKMQEDMKQLQPKMDELKKKYADNQQKLNKETMKLYRQEGMNPLGGCKSGCLPMLLQMPVFFALYAVLYNSIDLRGAYFVAWIKDLSAPDPWKVLPILMGVSMFWQQKMTGMGGGMGGGGAQQDQQKMMKWMMPVFLTFIFFRLSAGVVLYWLSFNVFTSLQQLLIKKKKKEEANDSK